MKRFIRFAGRDRICRLPTSEEWDQLADIVDEDDTQMHWDGMFSWCSCRIQGFMGVCVNRGCESARHFDWNPPRYRNIAIGFRPAFALPGPVVLQPGTEDGNSTVIGTLFMDGKPVQFPEYPSYDGDIEDFIPGATLEIRQKLPDPKYQIRAIKVGNSLVADRNLLRNISWDDLHQQGFC